MLAAPEPGNFFGAMDTSQSRIVEKTMSALSEPTSFGSQYRKYGFAKSQSPGPLPVRRSPAADARPEWAGRTAASMLRRGPWPEDGRNAALGGSGIWLKIAYSFSPTWFDARILGIYPGVWASVMLHRNTGRYTAGIRPVSLRTTGVPFPQLGPPPLGGSVLASTGGDCAIQTTGIQLLIQDSVMYRRFFSSITGPQPAASRRVRLHDRNAGRGGLRDLEQRKRHRQAEADPLEQVYAVTDTDGDYIATFGPDSFAGKQDQSAHVEAEDGCGDEGGF